jgi:hypothetical protein
VVAVYHVYIIHVFISGVKKGDAARELVVI